MPNPGKPLPTNSLRDSLLDRLSSEAGFRSHPAQRNLGGTKYISAFLAPSGQTFAVEKNVKERTPIWVTDSPRARQALDACRIGFDFYAVGSPRNSNLKTLPNFKDGALLRTYPATLDEALEFVKTL